jgi:excisionase family DNA binding protein
MTQYERFTRDDYVTIDEYASKMRVTERTVRTWIGKGAIVVERRGRTVRIPLAQFEPVSRGTDLHGTSR